jgi:hypothetical protein
MNDPYKRLKSISTLVCNSGLIIRVQSIRKMSTKPFEKMDQTAAALTGIPEGRLLYVEIDGNYEIIDTESKINVNLSNTINHNDADIFMKSIINSWIGIR